MKDIRGHFYRHYVSNFTRTIDLDNNKLSNDKMINWNRYQFSFRDMLCGLNENDKILELGCGEGRFLAYLKQNGYKNVLGIDICPEYIVIARNNGVDIKLGNVFSFLENKSNEYDCIVAIDFIEHFNKEELFQLLEMIFLALKSGGIFILQTPNGAGLFSGQVVYGDFTHFTTLNQSSLLQVLKEVGFVNVKINEVSPVPCGIKGFLRSNFWAIIKIVLNGIKRIETGKTQEIWTENMNCKCAKP